MPSLLEGGNASLKDLQTGTLYHMYMNMLGRHIQRMAQTQRKSIKYIVNKSNRKQGKNVLTLWIASSQPLCRHIAQSLTGPANGPVSDDIRPSGVVIACQLIP